MNFPLSKTLTGKIRANLVPAASYQEYENYPNIENKYFGEGPALGKFIKAQNRFELKVTGVIKDFPENSRII